MVKKVFRPFWSYDLQKTERWLSDMAWMGYRLQEVNFMLRTFVFVLTEQKSVTYRIVYSKFSTNQIASGLANEGWTLDVSSHRWNVIRNEKQEFEIALIPTREGILNRNKTIMYVIGILLLGLIGLILPVLLIIFIAILLSLISISIEISTERTPMPTDTEVPWYALAIGGTIQLICLLLLVIGVYSFFKLLSTNKKLRNENHSIPRLDFTIPITNLYDKHTEDKQLKSGQMIKKRKFAWMYSPDKLENWLENIESKGFNLYRMGVYGNSFYFVKGQPRQVKYSVDFKNRNGPDYYEINKQDDWKLIFTTPLNWQRTSIWAKVYSAETGIPEFYSDKTDRLKHARKRAMATSLMFLPLAILYIVMIALTVSLHINRDSDFHWSLVFMIIAFSLVIIEFSAFATLTISYYFRVKKKIRQG